jgi:putative transposase
VHLLATPHMEGGISKMMQYLGRQYVQHVNRTYGRSGTLWERRFLASLVETECCLLPLYRYIESNPVRAGLVAEAEHYRWSSARAHLVPNGPTFLAYHDKYLRLGDTPQSRAHAYLEASRTPLDNEVLAEIRSSIQHGVPLGSERFTDEVERQLGRRVRLRKPGRKPKQLRAST